MRCEATGYEDAVGDGVGRLWVSLLDDDGGFLWCCEDGLSDNGWNLPKPKQKVTIVWSDCFEPEASEAKLPNPDIWIHKLTLDFLKEEFNWNGYDSLTLWWWPEYE